MDFKLHQYLQLFQISNKKYIVGVFQQGITVYKQQVRALNILYCLLESKRLKTGETIGIIGGGVAGLTIAAAASKAGIKVEIFEQKRIFLHVQYGCDTRELHPNIYDWPDKRSLFPYADLPVLSWKYNTASHVCNQIFSGYKQTVAEHGGCNEHKSCYIFNPIPESENSVIIDYRKPGQDRKSIAVDILIFACGYGIEIGVEYQTSTPSYWRNDELSQLRLGNSSQKFLISGAGDGGLIDLFRLKLFGFSYDSIVRDIQCNLNFHAMLCIELNRIKEEWATNSIQNTNWLYEQFEGLYNNHILDSFLEKIRARLIEENIVSLNSNGSDVKSILNIDRISLMNALITFCLIKINAFTYESGNFTERGGIFRLRGTKVSKEIRVIARHGTRKQRVLEDLAIDAATILELKAKQTQNRSEINKAERMWPEGWWSQQFYGDSYKPSIEFFTPDTQSVCSSFVSVLSKVLEYFHERKAGKSKDFRVVLHRIVQIQDEFFFQQITPYYGTRLEGEVGRVFPITGGVAGYSARTGKAVTMEKKKENEIEFKTLMEMHVNHINARILPEIVSSLLTIPIFAQKSDGTLATNLILYIDSSESDFFSQDEEILDVITKSTEGFIGSIKRLKINGQIQMAETDFVPPSNDPDIKDDLVDKEFFEDISAELYKPEKTPLTFESFYSFDIIFNHVHNSFQ